MDIKKLDIAKVRCPICHIGTKLPLVQMIRDGDEVKCPECGYASPIIVVNHRIGYEKRNAQLYR